MIRVIGTINYFVGATIKFWCSDQKWENSIIWFFFLKFVYYLVIYVALSLCVQVLLANIILSSCLLRFEL